MIAKEEEVANLAAELKPKPKKRKNGFWVGFPVYWLPLIMLSVLSVTGGKPQELLDACRYLMIMTGISVLMCLLCLVGLSVFWMNLTKRDDKKEPFSWRALLMVLFLSCGSCASGVLLGIFWPSICYGASLLVVFFVAKIME
jgi:hypothetical protein